MKTTPLFSQIKTQETILYPDSSHFLTFSSSLPQSENNCRLLEFYKQIAALCRAFCEKKLLPSLIAREENDAFPHNWRYRFTVSVKNHFEKILVTVSVSLTDVTNRRFVYKTSQDHLWDSQGNYMLRKKAKSKKDLLNSVKKQIF